jgi:hypothetical protein
MVALSSGLFKQRKKDYFSLAYTALKNFFLDFFTRDEKNAPRSFRNVGNFTPYRTVSRLRRPESSATQL